MSKFQQTLEAFSNGEIDLAGLRHVLLQERARTAADDDVFQREVLLACRREHLGADTIDALLRTIDDPSNGGDAVHFVALTGHEAAAEDATVVADTTLLSDLTAFEDARDGALPATVTGSLSLEHAATGSGSAALNAVTAPGAPGVTDLPADNGVIATVSEPVISRATAANAGPAQKGRRLKPGDVLNDQFELEEAIGEGGMGQIFRAKDTLDLKFSNSNPYVAVKVLSDTFSGHKDSVMALHRETRNARKLQHENIINVYTFGQDSRTGQYFMVMEYLRGEPLNHYMHRKGLHGLPYEEVWRICSGVGAGLMHAHDEGIVHSDIKPSNIWITDAGKVKVLDFGIARVVNPDTQTVWGGLPAASVPYASQEMLRNQDADERDDVYALACVVYELLTGVHPYKKQGAIQAKAQGLIPDRPRGLKARQWKTLRQALCLQRDDRTANVEDFLEGMRPQSRRSSAVVGPVAASLLVMGAAAAYLLSQQPADQGPSEEERYLARLLEVEVTESLSEDDLPMYLQMGHEAIELGRADFANNDFQQGNQTLKNGPSVAFRDFYDVLRGTAIEERRLAAAKGIFTIQRLYANTIDRLRADGAVKTALWLACQSLAQPPGTRTPEWGPLRVHYEALWRDTKGETAPPPSRGCNSNEVQDVWGRDLTFRSSSGRGWQIPDRRQVEAAGARP